MKVISRTVGHLVFGIPILCAGKVLLQMTGQINIKRCSDERMMAKRIAELIAKEAFGLIKRFFFLRFTPLESGHLRGQ